MQEQLKHIWSTHGYYVGYQGKQVDFDIQWLSKWVIIDFCME